MGLQKNHDFTNHFLVCPCTGNLVHPFLTYTGQFQHALGLFLNGCKNIFLKRIDQNFREMGANSLDHP